MYTFIPNKSFGQLLDNSLKKIIFLKIFKSEFSYIKVWFTDQNSNPLEIEDKINFNLVINLSITYKKMTPIQFKQIFIKGYGFLSFAKNMGTTIGKNIGKQ